MEIIIRKGFEGMDQAMSILINEAMKVERAKKVLRADFRSFRVPWDGTCDGCRAGLDSKYKCKIL